MHQLRRWLPLAALFLTACEEARGIPGVWTGSFRTIANLVQPSRMYSFTLTLTETDVGVISGGGRLLNSPPDTLIAQSTTYFAVTVTGAHAHPSITLAIAPGGAQAMNFTGTVDGTLTRMDGVVIGSGFIGDSLHFVRNTPQSSARITAP